MRGSPCSKRARVRDRSNARPRVRPLNAVDANRLQELAQVFGERVLGGIAEREWAAWIDHRMAGNSAVTRERYIDLVMAFLTWCKKRPRCWLSELPVIERDLARRQRAVAPRPPLSV